MKNFIILLLLGLLFTNQFVLSQCVFGDCENSFSIKRYNDSSLLNTEVELVNGERSYGSLINSSMQVHITFKIVTREDKTTSVIHPINV